MIDVADGNKVYYYHFDDLGSVVALTDTSGTFVEYYKYDDVFGKPTIWDAIAQEIVESSVVGNPFMFTGRRFDDETGLYYYRARYYDPYIGRFLQTDPIRYAAGLNLYTYCGNNPIYWVDPWGLSRYWRWGWWDVITFWPHAWFEFGNQIGDAAFKVPNVIRQPEIIRQQWNKQLEDISEGGPVPTTAGPANSFGDWAEDVATVATTVPGTSLSGPISTSPLGAVPGTVVGGAMAAAEQAAGPSGADGGEGSDGVGGTDGTSGTSDGKK